LGDINPEIPKLFRIMVAIVPVQSWMARMALGWGVRDLACAAEVSPPTVRRFERGESLRVVTVEMIQRALENAGVIFIDANGGGPGVRLGSSGKAQLSGSGRWPSRTRGRRAPVNREGESVTESKESATTRDEVSELMRRVDELRKRLDCLTDEHW
jgi:transcriptional regulator with XRE-family HTH domain